MLDDARRDQVAEEPQFDGFAKRCRRGEQLAPGIPIVLRKAVAAVQLRVGPAAVVHQL